MIFFQNCIIQRQKTKFCILGKGKSSVQSICFLKSSYFCVLHPILGKRKLIFEIFDFQLSLLYISIYCVFQVRTFNTYSLCTLLGQTPLPPTNKLLDEKETTFKNLAPRNLKLNVWP